MSAAHAPLVAKGRFDVFGSGPMLAAIAVMNAITGLAAAVVLAPLSWGADVDFLRRGATGFLTHAPVPDFVFTPLCAVLAVPLALMPAPAAALAIAAAEAALLLTGVILGSKGLAPAARMLVGLAALTFLPVVNELLLGQVTLFIAASVYPLVSHDGRVRGIPLGIVLATIPKPLLVPVLIWMLVWRRQALVGAVVTAALLTLVGLVITGPDAYGWWLSALDGAGRVVRQGNVSAWSNGVTVAALGAAACVAIGFAWCLRRATTGFVAALAAGLLLAPYTLVYAASILVLVPVALKSRGATRWVGPLALVANPAAAAGWTGMWIGAGLAGAVFAGTRDQGAGFDGPA